MASFRLPEREKERNLQRVRSRLSKATPATEGAMRPAHPALVMILWSVVLSGIYLGIGALVTGKSAVQMAFMLSQVLGQSPLASAVMCWLSVIGLASLIHAIFTAGNQPAQRQGNGSGHAD